MHQLSAFTPGNHAKSIRNAAVFFYALTAPALASDAALIQTDRSIGAEFSVWFSDDPAPTTFSDSIASPTVGLFDEAINSPGFAPFPFNSNGGVSQNSTISNAAGLLSINASSSIESHILADSQNTAVGSALSSLLSVDFSVVSQSAWALDVALTATLNDNNFGNLSGDGLLLEIELTGPSGVVFADTYTARSPANAIGLDPGSILGVPVSFEFPSSGLIDPGAYTLDIRHTGDASIDFGLGQGFRDSGRFDADITFVVPAPSAMALLALAPLAVRRRR